MACLYLGILIFFAFSLVLTCGGILLTGSILVDKRSLTLLNVYGPCTDHRTFWKKCAEKGLLDHSDLIMAGDLNFNLNNVFFGHNNFRRSFGYFFKRFVC